MLLLVLGNSKCVGFRFHCGHFDPVYQRKCVISLSISGCCKMCQTSADIPLLTSPPEVDRRHKLNTRCARNELRTRDVNHSRRLLA